MSFSSLLTEVRACTICEADLPLGPRPVLQLDPQARILIAGQAPGSKVHDSGVPFDDASGNRLLYVRRLRPIDTNRNDGSIRWPVVTPIDRDHKN